MPLLQHASLLPLCFFQLLQAPMRLRSCGLCSFARKDHGELLHFSSCGLLSGKRIKLSPGRSVLKLECSHSLHFSFVGINDAAPGEMRSCVVPNWCMLASLGGVCSTRLGPPRAGPSGSRAGWGRGLGWACLGLFRPEPASVPALTGTRGEQRSCLRHLQLLCCPDVLEGPQQSHHT